MFEKTENKLKRGRECPILKSPVKLKISITMFLVIPSGRVKNVWMWIVAQMIADRPTNSS